MCSEDVLVFFAGLLGCHVRMAGCVVKGVDERAEGAKPACDDARRKTRNGVSASAITFRYRSASRVTRHAAPALSRPIRGPRLACDTHVTQTSAATVRNHMSRSDKLSARPPYFNYVHSPFGLPLSRVPPGRLRPPTTLLECAPRKAVCVSLQTRLCPQIKHRTRAAPEKMTRDVAVAWQTLSAENARRKIIARLVLD